MLMVLTHTRMSVKTTTALMLPKSIFTLPNMLTNPNWKARSVSARTSAEVFSKAAFTRSMTPSTDSAESAIMYQVPTMPQSSINWSSSAWWKKQFRSSMVPA